MITEDLMCTCKLNMSWAPIWFCMDQSRCNEYFSCISKSKDPRSSSEYYDHTYKWVWDSCLRKLQRKSSRQSFVQKLFKKLPSTSTEGKIINNVITDSSEVKNNLQNEWAGRQSIKACIEICRSTTNLTTYTEDSMNLKHCCLLYLWIHHHLHQFAPLRTTTSACVCFRRYVLGRAQAARQWTRISADRDEIPSVLVRKPLTRLAPLRNGWTSDRIKYECDRSQHIQRPWRMRYCSIYNK